ncbi:MAG: hypothetical protein WCP55_19605 [Lentisphaerota bacterium]
MGSLIINPLIMDIFAEARSRLGITRKTELRMSDGLLDCAGKVFREARTGKGIILIDADVEEYLDEGGIRFLIGHELGHLVQRGVYFSGKQLDELFGGDTEYPGALRLRINILLGEIVADLYGVRACGSVSVAVEAIDNLYGGHGLRERFYDSNTSFFFPKIFFWATAFALKSLKLLHNSVMYSDLLDSGSFDYDRELMSYDEYWDTLFGILAPAFLDYDAGHDRAISDCLAMMVQIMRFDHSGFWLFSGKTGTEALERALRVHAREPQLIEFGSDREDIILRFQTAAASIRTFDHPLKHDAFYAMTRTVKNMEYDDDLAMDFLLKTGGYMGFGKSEILEVVD